MYRCPTAIHGLETRLSQLCDVSLLGRRLFDLEPSTFILTLAKRAASAAMGPLHGSQLGGT